VRSSSPTYRSRLEVKVANQLTGTGFKYEPDKFPYKVEEARNYIPDFLLPNGIYIEAKGYLRTEDRKKLLLIKAQYPDIDLRLVFQRAANKIRKTSKTTYGEWASKNGFIYADHGRVPKSWLLQPS